MCVYVNGPRVKSPGTCAGVDMCVTHESGAALFGWDVEPRPSLCSTPNMDCKDPDIH